MLGCEVKIVKVSARNVLKGKVKSVEHGSVNSEVVLQLPGGTEIVSIITKTAAQNLGMREGKEAYVIIKTSNAMLATD